MAGYDKQSDRICTVSALCTYFSTMTAYAIHAYDFKLKKYIYAFILAVMMIPTQVTALGFVKLVGTLHMEDTFIPLIVPTIVAPVTFFYMKQYMESTLPVSLIEAPELTAPVSSIHLTRLYFH